MIALYCFTEEPEKLLLIPVVPDVLNVVVAFQHFQQLGHILDIVLAGQLDVVLGNHLDQKHSK